MRENKTSVGDFRARIDIIKSFVGFTPIHIWIFLALRTILLPLKKFHEVLPKNGKIVESIAVSLVGIFIAILLLISVVNYKERDPRLIRLQVD